MTPPFTILETTDATPNSVSDSVTFEELYRDRYVPMVRLATAIVDNRQDAEHVVQDAFVAVYKRFDRIDHPVSYLRTCVVNAARKMLRRRKLMRRTPDPAVEDDVLGFNHVFDVIRQLPASQRILIALRYEQQLTDDEIAEVMSIPVGTVKSRLHRALSTLRKELT